LTVYKWLKFLAVKPLTLFFVPRYFTFVDIVREGGRERERERGRERGRDDNRLTGKT